MNSIKDIVHFRAEQLCIMHLTRRKEIRPLPIDLFPNRTNTDIDLLFDLDDSNFSTGSIFGVTIKGAKQGVEQIRKMIRDFNPRKYNQIVYPVLLIAFEMTTDKGYYTWVNTPMPERKLFTPSRLKPEDMQELTGRTLAQIIGKIDTFYKR